MLQIKFTNNGNIEQEVRETTSLVLNKSFKFGIKGIQVLKGIGRGLIDGAADAIVKNSNKYNK